VSWEYKAFCWGYNGNGRLGDGTTTDHWVPVAVAGTLRFKLLSAGYGHTCGINRADKAFCWGYNISGQLGNGTMTDRLTPTLVGHGLLLSQVTAGVLHSCGVSPANEAYCWGENSIGQVGVVPGRQFSLPVRVVGAM
jgi:alpha-tubulin suppressor-like RCC1 family protein